MADHSGPTTATNYLSVPAQLDARIDDALLGLDPATTSATNVPTNTIRFSSASAKWQKWNGSTWNDLASAYAITVVGLGTGDTPSFTGVRATSTTAATLGSSGHALQAGDTAGANLAISPAVVQARNNGSAAALSIQTLGGNTTIGSGGNTISLRGIFGIGPGVVHTVGTGGVLGAITASHIELRGEGDTTDTLGTLPAGTAGDIIIIRFGGSTTYNLTIIDSTSISLAGGTSFVMNNARDNIAFLYTGGTWTELWRSENT